MAVNPDFKELFSALNTAEARYLVVGAYAVIHYADPRYTKDLDIWIEPERENATRVLKALATFGAPVAGLTVANLCDPEMVFQIGMEPNRVDILMGLTGLEFVAAWVRAEDATYGGEPIRVLGIDDLMLTKRAAGRPQDQLDVERLALVRRRRAWRLSTDVRGLPLRVPMPPARGIDLAVPANPWSSRPSGSQRGLANLMGAAPRTVRYRLTAVPASSSVPARRQCDTMNDRPWPVAALVFVAAIWSIGNEVGEQYTAEEGAALAARLRGIVREEDPTRPTTTAMNFAKPDMPLPAAVDVIGLNYQGEGIRDRPEFEGTRRIRTSPQYAAFHARFPDKVVLSSETASAFSSRGVYLFPVSQELSAPVRDGQGGDSQSRHVTACELHAVDFGSSVDKVFGSIERHPFVAGEFVWTGWDHLGEPTPYDQSRSSYSGIIDLAGFKKDRFYLYQAHWRPDHPMAHILPHWTWPERAGQVTPVHVFTSGDEAELYLNGRSLGRKAKGPYEYRLRWDDVVYEPGTLEVVAYRTGRRWATDVVKTAQPAARLEAQPDRAEIRADGRDLAFVTVRVVDEGGVVVPRADNRIRLGVDGPGEIVATDNGDPTSFESFQTPERKAFSGLCLVIVRAKKGQSGRIDLTATSDGLRPGLARISTLASQP